MEIETTKTRTLAKNKRNHNSIQGETVTFYKTPLKITKTNNYHLTLTEKSFIHLSSVNGHSPEQISKSVKRDKRCVKKFISKSSSRNSFSPKHNDKGRWKKGSTRLNESQKRILKRWLDNGEVKSSREAWIRLSKVKNLPRVSYGTVNSYLKTLGAFVQPSLKSEVSESNKAKRLKYCKKYERFNFRKVLFTDESSFQLNANTFRVFQFKGQTRPTKPKLNPNSKVMVWAGIGYEGKTSLHFVKGSLKSEGYVNILKSKRKEMLELFRSRAIWYFQQDGAPCHRPKRVKNYIKRWVTGKILPHPAQSPDLNPIELIWAQMKRKVEEARPQTLQALRAAIISSWESISVENIRKCINNLQKKMKEIIKNNGSLL